jgi:site-specific DNA recombinase
MNGTDKRCVIYTRVSSELQQEHGTSLGTQLDACKQYAAQNGYEVVAHADEGVGDSMTQERLALQRALDLVRTGQANVFLCTDLDRLSRDVADQWDIKRQVERAGGELKILQLPAQDTESYLILFAMQGVVSTIEKRAIIRRTTIGKQAAARQGKVLGGWMQPYGYRFVKGEARWEAVEDELLWVRRMYEWCVDENCTLGEIARRLNAAGVPTKRGLRVWSFTTIRDILLNDLYSTGMWYWKKTDQRDRRNTTYKGRKPRPREEWIGIPITPPGEEPPVPVDMAELVQAQLQRNKDMAARRTKREYTLRGMVFCEECGYRMRGMAKGKRTCYKCNNRYNLQRHLPLDARCQNAGNFYCDEIDELVWQAVLRVVSDEELIRSTLGKSAEQQAAPQEDLSVLEKQARELARRLENLYDLAEAGDIERGVFRERKAKIDEKLATTQAALLAVAQRKAEQERAREALADIVELCRDVREGLPLIPVEDRRAFYLAIGLRAYVGQETVRVEGLLGATHTALIPSRVDRAGGNGASAYGSTSATVSIRPVKYPFGVTVPLARKHAYAGRS